ncbi:PREDICTED: uncharacterized protein LOC107338857 [Acropora digitifera]|uniref:uncharacterized protein LOC107338857 n=1 Tax=Acropora digitifera TaxID=70779 RepID=UPI00077A0D8A|nr:PREDICTED: uncharacterized protein LOC107338857 [Acropora digitifera]
MDNHLEDILFHQYIRIALAIVIIRKKPRGISAGAYIDEMLKEIEMQDRKMKVGECSKVMLKRQQDLMAVILSKSGVEIGVNNSSSRLDKVESSRSTFNCENFALLSRHGMCLHCEMGEDLFVVKLRICSPAIKQSHLSGSRFLHER